MGINVYTGLMGSGKSYEVVSQVIVKAIATGRRVVTNIDGIDPEKIYTYCAKVLNADPETLGTVVLVSNDDVKSPTFFPSFEDVEQVATVHPGDLACIDEAWRFWSSSDKLHPRHKSFFLEHRHFVDKETSVACDLVLMVQEISTLNRFVRSVVAFTFRTHKKISLGLEKNYSVNIFEGGKAQKAFLNATFIRKYDPAIFPLYSSFKGGVQGTQVAVDKRVNIFAGPKIWVMGGLSIAALVFSIFFIYRFLTLGKDQGLPTPEKMPLPFAQTQPPPPPPPQEFSTEWRYAGSIRRGDSALSVLVGHGGFVRPESPSVFKGEGVAIRGQLDGQTITTFSGSSGKSSLLSVDQK